MGNEMVKVFETAELGSVRVVVIDDEPWFVGKDVAVALGYENPQKAIRMHVHGDDKNMGEQNGHPSQSLDMSRFFIVDDLGRKQYPVLINESGMYALIFGSKLPSAKAFKRWVTSEVLPAIRKTGSYNMPNFANPVEAARAWADAQEAKQLAESKVNELKPKADYCDDVIGADGTESITRIAQDYGKTACQMNALLSQLHIQYAQKDKNGKIKYWLLYKEYHGKGYTKNVSYPIGDGKIVTTMKWTAKGRKFIYDTLKTIGMLPVITA